MSTNFRIGQKVVCVPQNPGKWNHSIPTYNGPCPEDNHVYTVNGYHFAFDFPAIFLKELPSWTSWDARDFRPAVERGTDTGMAILTKILLDNMVDA